MRQLTVDELIEECRSLIDETNREHIDDDLDIVPALNRAQDKVANILARHYEDPLLYPTDVALTDGVADYTIPSNALEHRLEKVEIKVGKYYQPVFRISYRELTQVENDSASVSTPTYYCVIGNSFRLVPIPSGAYPMRIWYLKDPEPLVRSQGRILIANPADNSVIVNELGSDLDTISNDLNCFVNIIDGVSGEVKFRGHIQSLDTNNNKIYFRTTLISGRESVLGRELDTELPSTVTADDHVCLIHGTCIPYLRKPFTLYIVQQAVAELQYKLGGNADMAYRIAEELEKVIKKAWVGREKTLRVKRSGKYGL